MRISSTQMDPNYFLLQFQQYYISGDLPGIVEYGWGSYPGGAQKAIDDNVILPLNDLIDKYAANFKRAIAADFGYFVDDSDKVQYGGMTLKSY